jgi:uncharacterized membrane protein
MKNLKFWIIFAFLVAAFLPVSVKVQGIQQLQYQYFNGTLAAAQDVSTENTETDSQRQERDRAVGVTGLLFIVVVIAIGVLFAIIMVTGHGSRQSP